MINYRLIILNQKFDKFLKLKNVLRLNENKKKKRKRN